MTALSNLCLRRREVGGERCCRRDVGELTPLHDIGDAALIDLEVRRDPRVVVFQMASELDNRHHVRSDLAVLHGRILQLPLEAGAGRCDSDAVWLLESTFPAHPPSGLGLVR